MLALPIHAMRAYVNCAFLMLTILAIGPLARLDTWFLPLLHNRRHFGVITGQSCGAAVWNGGATCGHSRRHSRNPFWRNHAARGDSMTPGPDPFFVGDAKTIPTEIRDLALAAAVIRAWLRRPGSHPRLPSIWGIDG